jgi:type II secretory pathway predicted ATPase ExeA
MSEKRDIRAHFGFTALPFTREIPVAKRWASPIFDEPLAALEATVQERMSAVLVAPAGAGKTALLRALVARLPEARYRVHYVKVTALSKRDMCREIAVAAGAPASGTYPTLVRRLEERFDAALNTDAVRPVLVIDEGHDMRPEVLGILRLLTNYDMDSRLVLSVILAGQPPLARLLRRDELEDVSRRMAHCATLRLLSRDETRQYIEHRVRVAGAKKLPFDEPSIDAVFEMARGNLGATDSLCYKCLELAAAQAVATVDSSLVVAARKFLP